MPTRELRSLIQAEAGKAGLGLSPAILDRLEAHCRLLARWNRAVRLVGDASPSTLVRRHVLESLALVPLLHEPRGSLLDIGSGNGFPAIPLKCALPELRVVMLEPTLRKSVFLGTVIRELGLADCDVIRARVDRKQDLTRLGRWDCITMRAVAAIAPVLAGGASALRAQGRILFMVGEAGKQEILRRLEAPLELVAAHQLPETRASYVMVVGLPGPAHSETIH